MLWAWEKPADLRFLKPADAGVAFFAAHLFLQPDGGVRSQLRAQPLLLTPGLYRMAVVRLDTQKRPPLSAKQRETAAQMVEEAYRITKADALQIDFDAPESAYPFYRALLADIRRRLGPKVFVSMTALVWWCGPRSWLTDLPVDEIVPMAFTSGKPAEFAAPQCRGSIGLRLGISERPPKLPSRVYVFLGGEIKSWNAKSFDRLQNEFR